MVSGESVYSTLQFGRGAAVDANERKTLASLPYKLLPSHGRWAQAKADERGAALSLPWARLLALT